MMHAGQHRRITNSVLRKRLVDFQKIILQNSKEYCSNTTLHGLKYFVNTELHPIERSFFVLSFLIFVLLSGYFIINTYNKWSEVPLIYIINPKPTFITQEPFPAVTICNLNQALTSEVEKYSIYSQEYATVQMLCKREVNITVAKPILNRRALRDLIFNIAQPCSAMVRACQYGAISYNCSDLFHPIITDGGLCCTFNMVHPSLRLKRQHSKMHHRMDENEFVPVVWTTQNGYPKKLPKKFFPRTAVGTGETLGLIFSLNAQTHQYYCSLSPSVGFKILLHNPNEMPNLREIGLLLNPGEETKVRVQAEKVEAEKSISKLNRNKRRCIFQDEVQLDYFTFYTQRNCEVECFMKNILEECNCIPYYILADNKTVCGVSDSPCEERVRIESLISGAEGNGCTEKCIPGCFDLTYLPDFSSTIISSSANFFNESFNDSALYYIEKNIAIVKIYYKENTYRSIIQTEFIGITDFLSSVGGLIGLFFGFSFISLVEIIFYVLIRPWRAASQLSKSSAKAMRRIINKRNRRVSIGHYGGYHSQYLKLGNKSLYMNEAYQRAKILTSISETIDEENFQISTMKYNTK